MLSANTVCLTRRGDFVSIEASDSVKVKIWDRSNQRHTAAPSTIVSFRSTLHTCRILELAAGGFCCSSDGTVTIFDHDGIPLLFSLMPSASTYELVGAAKIHDDRSAIAVLKDNNQKLCFSVISQSYGEDFDWVGVGDLQVQAIAEIKAYTTSTQKNNRRRRRTLSANRISFVVVSKVSKMSIELAFVEFEDAKPVISPSQSLSIADNAHFVNLSASFDLEMMKLHINVDAQKKITHLDSIVLLGDVIAILVVVECNGVEHFYVTVRDEEGKMSNLLQVGARAASACPPLLIPRQSTDEEVVSSFAVIFYDGNSRAVVFSSLSLTDTSVTIFSAMPLPKHNQALRLFWQPNLKSVVIAMNSAEHERALGLAVAQMSGEKFGMPASLESAATYIILDGSNLYVSHNKACHDYLAYSSLMEKSEAPKLAFRLISGPKVHRRAAQNRASIAALSERLMIDPLCSLFHDIDNSGVQTLVSWQYDQMRHALRCSGRNAAQQIVAQVLRQLTGWCNGMFLQQSNLSSIFMALNAINVISAAVSVSRQLGLHLPLSTMEPYVTVLRRLRALTDQCVSASAKLELLTRKLNEEPENGVVASQENRVSFGFDTLSDAFGSLLDGLNDPTISETVFDDSIYQYSKDKIPQAYTERNNEPFYFEENIKRYQLRAGI